MAAAARTWGDYVRRELTSINTASRAADMKTLREIVDTLRVVVNRCCAAEKNAEGLEEPPVEAEGNAARLVAPEQAAEPHEWVRNGNGKEVWYRNTVTDEIAWEVPPGGILRAEGERPPPPAVGDAARLEAGAVPRFATAANRAAARGAVPPPSAALATRAGRLAPNMEGCDGVTPEDCRAARVKLRRVNSQLAASVGNGSNLAAEPVTPPGTPPGTPPSSLAASPVAGQSGGKRRGRRSRISRKKKNKKSRKSRKMNRRYMER